MIASFDLNGAPRFTQIDKKDPQANAEKKWQADIEARQKAPVAGQAEIILARQRNGPIGEAKLHWHEFTRFDNAAYSGGF